MSNIPMSPARTGWTRRLRKLAPVAAIAAVFAAVFALGLDDYLSFQALRENREVLMQYVADNAALSVVIFIAVYAATTTLSLPGGAILTIAGGFLFGAVFGSLWVVIGATLGATGVFLAARSAFGQSLRAKAGPWLKKMEDGFNQNALSYLLVLRLVPIFPFFVVNLVPALVGVSLRTYVLATVIGIIPGSFVFASVGAGLGSVFDSMQDFSPAAALTPEVIIALVGLALLSLVPVGYKILKASRSA